jgi:multicomponent Na+:H+ antiporter subunit A
MKLLYLLSVLFGLAIAAPFVNLHLRRYSGWILSVVPLLIFAYFITLLPDISAGAVIIEKYSWIFYPDISLSFRLDGLSMLFALLVTGIGGLILIYAGYYMRSYEKTSRFFGYLVFFMAAMLGLVLSSNLICLFVFWELTSISSFLLIGFKYEKAAAREAALQALLITGFGGLALLAGFVLLSIPYGSFELEVIMSNPQVLANSDLFVPVLILILIGAFTKSAIFPFHFWLPGAMQAPSPVSAFLHSATMVKAGIFLLARLNPLMDSSELWFYTLSVFGAVTMFAGAWLSISQNDIKKVLAYTTVSALGTLVLLIGTNTTYSMKAFIIFLLVHALYKATLFMMAGNIEKKTGTRDIRQLGQLHRYMPVAALIMILALLSMAGLPPMLGFIGKELIYEAKINAPGAANIVLLLGFFANIFMVFVSVRLAIDVFWGKNAVYARKPYEPDISLLTGPAVLVFLSLFLGLFPDLIENSLATPAVLAISPEAGSVDLRIWHGFNLVLLLSAFTIAIGVLLYIYKEWTLALAGYITLRYFRTRLSKGFFNMIRGFISLTKKKTSFIQHGYHRFYLMTIFIATSILVWYMLLRIPFHDFRHESLQAVPFFYFAIAGLIIIAAIFTVTARSRLIALISIGLVSFGISVIFITFSGVDLAITMIMVETLMVILGAMVVYHLPKYLNFSKRGSRVRDGLVALVFGGFMTLLVIKAGGVAPDDKISDFFSSNSYGLAYGKNIVNVILVDFRALDTMGEILVLSLAAIGIYALLKVKLKPGE